MTTKYITFYGESFDTENKCILAEANILEKYATIYNNNWDIILWGEILHKYNRPDSYCQYPDNMHFRILPQINTEFNETYLASVRRYIGQIFTDCIPNLDPDNIPTMSGLYDLEFTPTFALKSNTEYKND